MTRRARHGLALAAGALGLAAVGALATARAATLTGNMDVRAAIEPLLAAVERVPDRALLEQAAGGEPADKALREIAGDANAAPLTRVQALTALGDYPSPASEPAMRREVEDRVAALAGSQVVELRAALMAYARIAGPGAAGTLRLVVGHPVPDVRADAARAARLAKARELVPDLRERLVKEPVDFVRVELIESIRVLSL